MCPSETVNPVSSEEGGTPEPTAERIGQLIAHRACANQEANGADKIAGFCVVCGVPWPCVYAGPVPSPADVDAWEVWNIADTVRLALLALHDSDSGSAVALLGLVAGPVGHILRKGRPPLPREEGPTPALDEIWARNQQNADYLADLTAPDEEDIEGLINVASFATIQLHHALAQLRSARVSPPAGAPADAHEQRIAGLIDEVEQATRAALDASYQYGTDSAEAETERNTAKRMRAEIMREVRQPRAAQVTEAAQDEGPTPEDGWRHAGALSADLTSMANARDAWRAFVDHVAGCVTCARTGFPECADGNELHEAAKAADDVLNHPIRSAARSQGGREGTDQ